MRPLDRNRKIAFNTLLDEIVTGAATTRTARLAALDRRVETRIGRRSPWARAAWALAALSASPPAPEDVAIG